MVSVAAESDLQVPLFSSANFLISYHCARSPDFCPIHAFTVFQQETENSNKMVFSMTEKPRGSLGQEKQADGDLSLGQQGQAWWPGGAPADSSTVALGGGSASCSERLCWQAPSPPTRGSMHSAAAFLR